MSHLNHFKKHNRSNMPDAEQILWRELRAHRFCNLKFRRQVVLGNYIVDFISFSLRLVIELDGSQHCEQESYDQIRTHWLQNQGFRVVRFWNNQIFTELDNVLEAIRYHVFGEE